MSESRRILDARGLACPEPVIRTKKAFEEGGFQELEVLVDNQAAKENVSRFAQYAKASIKGIYPDGPGYRLVLSPGPQGASSASVDLAAAAKAVSCPDPLEPEGATVLIPSTELGRGDSTLGALLMKGFLYALAEGDKKPARIVFMNSGVQLCIQGSESLENLKRLEAAGVEVLACGTCLDFYKVKEKLGVGRISNMYEIAGFLLNGRSISL